MTFRNSVALALLTGSYLLFAKPAAAQQVGAVFVIQLENHNFTQPASDNNASLQPILGNAAAPYINSLITPGNTNAKYVSYASAYHNVLSTVSGDNSDIHPSEPNYIWGEAGSNYGVLDDNDPYGTGGSVATITSNNGGATPEHLTELLQIAGTSWRSYQEDTNLLTSTGVNINTNTGGTLTTNVASPSQYTVPLSSFSGSGASYTNPYNGSNQYNFACKHDGSLFFADTNGNGVTGTNNTEVSHYAPLQQLAADLANNTVARYNVITPDLYNDMHYALSGGFTYHGTSYTDDEANIAQGDNFLSILIPQIMASQAFQNNGMIIIWTDEVEGATPLDSFDHCLTEIIISPLAKGNAYNSTLNYTHSSDIATLQRIFDVAAGTPSGYLGDAANLSSPNADGSGAAQDLSDMLQPGATLATLSGAPTVSIGHTLREHYPFTSNANDALGVANLSTQLTGISYPSSGGPIGGYLHLSGTGYLLASLSAGSAFSLLGDYTTFHPFSMSFWLRQTAAEQANLGASTAGAFGLTTNSSSSSTWNTGFEMPTKENTSDLDFELRIRNGGTGTSDSAQLDTGKNISDGNWHHVALTYLAGSRYAYIDNTFCGTNSVAVSITTNPLANFTVGTFLRNGSDLDLWTGDVSDLQVYDGAFSATDVQQLYQSPGQTIVNNATTTATLPADVVDPMIGVANGLGTGEEAPGACLPQSSIYPSPDTSSTNSGGYVPGSNVVGFSQLHASGAGNSVDSYGNFLISPRLGNGITESSDASPISNIVAHPYEFSCELTTWSTTCVVAPTAHSAIYQFTFPSSTNACINVDVARKISSSTGMTSGSVTFDPVNGIVSGGGTFSGNWNPAPYNVYFYAMVDATPQSAGTWLGSASSSGVYTQSTSSAQSMGGWFSFNTSTGPATIHMKIAVSFESVAMAEAYLQNEIPGWDLGGAAANARTQWNNALSAVQIPGAGTDDARKYYTALFHSFITPRNRTGDQAVWPSGQPFWDDHYTNWDTWQTLYPLLDIIAPSTVASIVNSYGARYTQNGIAETVFTQGKDFQAGQGGDEVDRVIGDAWTKGIPGINWTNIWPLLQSHANRRTTDYLNLGYASIDGSHGGYDSRFGSGSATLAFAHDDWCAAQVATGLGYTSTGQTLLNRSSNWKNVWNAAASDPGGFTGFLQGRYENGTFDNQAPTSGDDFYEGSEWNYSFNVYHDPAGMVSLMGGRNRFIQRLEYGLAASQTNSNYFDFTNEPAFPKPFLFCYANRPYLSSYWTDYVRSLFTEYGLPGDDDSGAMSSLYIFMTSGFYPIATQNYYYLFGSRLPSAQFAVGTSGSNFTVNATNSSTANGQNLYVQSATLNGQPLTTPIIHHSDILAGSTLNYVMGPYPTNWGCGPDLQPPTLSELVLPVNGAWTAALGSPTITNGTTNSPVWAGASGVGNSAIYSGFPQVALSQPGDSLTLTATVQLQGLTATQGASSNLLAWGLFNNTGQTGVSGWSGYLAANDTDSSSKQWLSSKVTGNSTPFYTASGTNNLESFALTTPTFASETYYLILTLTENSLNGLDYVGALVRASDGVLFSAFTGTDLSPATLSFNNVGLRLGSSASASAVNVSQCNIIARRTTYSGRSLVVPTGGQFYDMGNLGANLTVSAGGVLSSGSSVSNLTLGSTSLAGGSTFDVKLASDGSTGSAGTSWDQVVISGTLNLSSASPANPVTIHLMTMSNASTTGPLASWNPNVSHTWVGFATATAITSFNAQSFTIDTSAFQDALAGTFSVQSEANGTTLDLVYTAYTNLQNWRLTYFGTTANSGNAADAFDYSHSGISNLMKYAFGLDPTSPASNQIPQPILNGGTYSMSFTQPAGVAGVTYGAQWTNTLNPPNWQPVPDTGSSPAHIFSISVGSNPSLFMRWQITDP